MTQCIQIAFKANRKEYFFNKSNLHLRKGDSVIVQAENGVDLGTVSLTHEQIPSSEVEGKELRYLIRLAIPDEIKKIHENRDEEKKSMNLVRERIARYGLKMKLVDAEFQFDRRRLVFFFTADKRVDFRLLVRDLASEFKTRIELRQIGVRDEAKRVDGYGPCGKRLCCSEHLTDFKPITTEFAKDQGLQLNPSKLTGLCGRLKCCLAYERDFYVRTLSKFPGIGSPIRTSKGPGEVKHVDIIGNKIHIKHDRDDEWETLTLEQVAEILHIDLSDVQGCAVSGDGCQSGKCETHDKVKSGEIENPIQDLIDKDTFFEDHNIPPPQV